MEFFNKQRNVWMSAAALFVSCGVLAGGAMAQAGDDESANEKQSTPDLSGPKVSEDATKPEGGPMMGGDNAQQRRGEPRVSQRLWMRELEKLNISTEQQSQVDAIMAEFHAEQQSYREQYGKELEALMAQVREARQNQQEVPVETRKEFQKLRESAPKFEDYQQRIWETLDTNQRELLTKNIEVALEQMRERNAPRGRGEGQPRRPRPDAMDDRAPGMDDEQGADRPRWRGFDERGRHRMEFLMRHRLHQGEGRGAAADDDEMDAPRRPRRPRGAGGPEMPPPPPPPPGPEADDPN